MLSVALVPLSKINLESTTPSLQLLSLISAVPLIVLSDSQVLVQHTGADGGGAAGGAQYHGADLPTTMSMWPSLFTSSGVRLDTSETPKSTMPSLALPSPPWTRPR